MARRPPARVRAATHRRLEKPVPSIPGLSPRGRNAVAHLERTRLWPGAAREALDTWTRFLRDPDHRLSDTAYGCGVQTCCPDPIDQRRILHIVIQALPRPDARTLRRHITHLDAQW